MVYVISIEHNRGKSFFQNYENGFGAMIRAKSYNDLELAEAACENIRCWLVDEMTATAYYLGYRPHTLRVESLPNETI